MFELGTYFANIFRRRESDANFRTVSGDQVHRLDCDLASKAGTRWISVYLTRSENFAGTPA